MTDRGTSLKSFYIRRAFRILPAALTYLAVICVLSAIGILAVGWKQIAASLFFYRNYLGDSDWFTGHYWSLSIEEQFYLLWPFVLVLAGTKRARMFAIAGILEVVVWRQIHWPLPWVANHYTGMRLDAILCGSVMALSWSDLKPTLQKASAFVIPAATVGFLAADAWSYALQGFTDFIQALLICVLIGSTVASSASWQSRILEFSVLKWVGRLSYSIYLWQELFLQPVPAPHWQLPLRVGIFFVLAWLSYRFIERPMIAMGQRVVKSYEKKPTFESALA